MRKHGSNAAAAAVLILLAVSVSSGCAGIDQPNITQSSVAPLAPVSTAAQPRSTPSHLLDPPVEVLEVDIFTADSRVASDGTVELVADDHAAYRDGQFIRRVRPIEQGIWNGVPYWLVRSSGQSTVGAGGLGNYWTTSLYFDPIDDEVSIIAYRGDLWIHFAASILVSAGADRYPRSSSAIRIDANEPFTSSNGDPFAGEQAAQIIDQLRSAKTVTTRYINWPEHLEITDMWSPGPHEIEAVFHVLEWMRANADLDALRRSKMSEK
jgi:hypothetical protein